MPEGLGGEDVFDLAGADAEGERAEGAMGAGMAIAADDGEAGEGEAEFGADDVDDALAAAAEVVEGDAELAAVLAHGFDLAPGHGFVDIVLIDGGDVVVEGGEGEVGAADGSAGEAEAFEGLGAGDFVDEVAIDVEEGGVFGSGDLVRVPDELEEG